MFAISLIALYLLSTSSANRDKIIRIILGILWIWAGLIYHITYFTEINKAAFGFGALFIIQGGLFLFGKKLVFPIKGVPRDFVAYFLISAGVVLYPIAIYFLEKSVYTIISIGLPCPTTIVTFGFLILARNSFARYYLIIPIIWTIIGTSAAKLFGVYPDYLMAVAAIIAIVFSVSSRKEISPGLEM